MEFVHVQVNGTQEYVHDSLNTTKVVVLEFLFPYGFIYEMGPSMSEKQVKESQLRVAPLSFRLGEGRGVTNSPLVLLNNSKEANIGDTICPGLWRRGADTH